MTAKPPAPTGKAPFMRCPHCDANAFIRRSQEVAPLYRDIIYSCTNADCGHTWKAQLGFVYSISVPANPKPGLDLPVCPTGQSFPTRAARDPPAPDLPASIAA